MSEIEEQNQKKLAWIGQQLKEAREQKKYSLNYVAEVTRINIGILNEIEEGQLKHSPGSVFVRGFIRTYAKLVGVDDEKLQQELEEIQELNEPSGVNESKVLKTHPDKDSSKSGKFLLILFALVSLIAGYFVFSLLSDKTEENLKASTTITTTTLPPPPPDTAPSPEKTNNEKLETAANAEVTAESVESSISSTSDSVTAATEPPPEITEKPETLETPAKDVLTLSVKGIVSTWLNLTIDDKAPLEVLVDPGEQINWEATQSFRITIGNAKGVEISLNGIPQSINQEKELLVDWVLEKPKQP